MDPVYRKGNQQPDTSQTAVGMIDWVGAVERGTRANAGAATARESVRQMRSETQGLILKNASDAMLLDEQRLHHQNRMEHLTSEKHKVNLERAYAAEEASIHKMAIESDMMRDATMMDRQNFEDYKTAKPLIGYGKNAIASKDPATAYGVYLELNKAYPNTSSPYILEMKGQLKELWEPAMQGVMSKAEQAELTNPGHYEMVLGQEAQKFQLSADPAVQNIIGPNLLNTVGKMSAFKSQERAKNVSAAIDNVMLTTGASEEVAKDTVALSQAYGRLGLGDTADKYTLVDRQLKLNRGELERNIEFKEGAAEGNFIDQRALGFEIAASQAESLRMSRSFEKRRLEIAREEEEEAITGVPRTLGGADRNQMIKQHLLASPFMVFSQVQDFTLKEIKTRRAEIATLMSKGDGRNNQKLIDADMRLADAEKEIGWLGGMFSLVDFDNTTDLKSAMKSLKDYTGGFNKDPRIANAEFDNLLGVLDGIWIPQGTAAELRNYEKSAMDYIQQGSQAHLDNLAQYHIPNLQQAPIVPPQEN